jgi:hypothetical protein
VNRRTGKKSAQLTLILLLLVCRPVPVEAGFVKIWQIEETAAAPVLVVVRVLSVRNGAPIPEGSLAWKAETLAMVAEVQSLRSFGDASTDRARPVAGDRLEVAFFAYGPSVTAFINGYPPQLPVLKPGQVFVLPLRLNRNPASDPWQLMADSGVSLIIPALAELPDSEQQPASARVFLDREIANVLSRGTPPEVFAIANYLQGQDDLTGELMPLMEPAIGDNRDRWAEVAANLLASQGIPRPGVADLLATKLQSKDLPGRQSLLLTQTALQKLKVSPETDALLIGLWIAEAPVHAWGSSASLIEFADIPVTTETLRRALQSDLSGSATIAQALVHTGYRTWLPDALARAMRVVERPDPEHSEVQAAAALLRDQGSDGELTQLADLVRKYQRQDEKLYSLLWQSATLSGNPREARVLSVVLLDRRIVFGQMRYCDYAVNELEKATGRHFGSDGNSDPGVARQRDGAVTEALHWLKSQGLSR